MSSVTETVKEKLVGSTEEPSLSHQARANFFRHAQKDDKGDSFMNEEDFINAVAPKQEDYVSLLSLCSSSMAPITRARGPLLICLFPPSTKSSASSMASSFAWRTDGEPAN